MCYVISFDKRQGFLFFRLHRLDYPMTMHLRYTHRIPIRHSNSSIDNIQLLSFTHLCAFSATVDSALYCQ